MLMKKKKAILICVARMFYFQANVIAIWLHNMVSYFKDGT
jgi:hypothetical protein